jgi:PEGA domain
MNARYLPVILAFAAAVLACEDAAAQQAAPPRAEVVSRADALYKEGVRLYSEKKWTEAEAAFRSAWEINPTFDVAYNLGSAEYQLGQYRDATEHLSLAVHNWPLLTATSGLRQTAQQRLDDSRARVGALTVKINVEHAEVLVDGKAVGRSPLAREVFVDPGTHVVEATLAGYKPARTQVDAPKGSSQDVALALVPVPAPPPGGQTSDAGGPRKPVIITGAALGGAGVILGAVFAGLSDAKASDVNAKHDAIVNMGAAAACGAAPSAACQALLSAKQSQATFANASAWSFIAGGAVGAATVIYAVAAPRAAKNSGMRVVPLVAADGAGVALRGEW